MGSSDAVRVTECDNEIARLHAEIRRVRTIRNSYLPISRLPPEILCRVFTCVRDLPPTSNRLDYLSWVRDTTHICYHWRTVALNCPELWSHLYFYNVSPEWMELQVKRAKKSLLSVELVSRGERCEKALLSALQNPGQLRSLNIGGTTRNTISKYMIALRGAYAPFLQRLVFKTHSIVHGSPSDEYLPSDLFSGGTPSLREVDIMADKLLPFSSPVFRGLSILKINTTQSSLIVLDELFAALDCSPGLKVLDIVFRFFETLADAHRSRAAKLPNIEKARIMSTLPNSKAILQHLALPISAKLDIPLFDSHKFLDLPLPHCDMTGLAAAIKNVWISDPPSSGCPIIWDTSMKSLDYMITHDNFQIDFWSDHRDFRLLNHYDNTSLPSLRVTGQSKILSTERYPVQFVAKFSMDHLESAFIQDDSSQIWNLLMGLPSLKSVALAQTSASTFVKHALDDPVLCSSTQAASAADLSIEASSEDSVIPPPLTRFPNLANISFSDVGFVITSDDSFAVSESDPEWFVKFEELMMYLQLRHKHRAPIRAARFDSCTNFTAKQEERVREIVEDVHWDGFVQMSNDDGSEDEWCSYCEQQFCYGECEY